MAGKKKRPPPKPDVLKAFSLTRDNDNVLGHLRQQAGDELGRTISGSAIIRALLTYAGAQGPAWIRSTVLPLIDQELSAGVKWGKPKA
jgi:hypothetical protein